MRFLIMPLVALALASCGAQSSSTQSTSRASAPAAAEPTPEAGTPAVAAAGPKAIDELTDQKLIYECPKCGMDFETAGKCTMDGTELIATRVDYTCPADHQAVARAGKCPRCAMNARVEKTAVAAAVPSGK